MSRNQLQELEQSNSADVAAQLMAEEIATAKFPAELRFEKKQAHSEKRNFRLGVYSGIFYTVGISFISKSTIVPSFLSHLTNSNTLLGIVTQFDPMGWFLPQLFLATFVVHRTRKMPLYNLSVLIRAILFLGVAVITLTNPNPILMLWVFVFGYATFHLTAGMGGVVFMELLAKAIPQGKRGRFLGVRLSVSSILTATLGAATITALLGIGSFPTNFGYVFLAGAVITIAGLLFMSFMREPRTKHPPQKRSLSDQFRVSKELLKSDRRFVQYAIAKGLFSMWMMGIPFYILFAHRVLGYTTAELGIFIATECFGYLISNLFWSRIADRKSTLLVLKLTSYIAILLPVLILGYIFLPLPRLLFPIIFALSAAVDSGTTIGGFGYLIEISPERERATYVGTFNTLMGCFYFLTCIGGIMLDLAGFTALYALVAVIGIGTFYAVRKLEIPKHLVALKTPTI